MQPVFLCKFLADTFTAETVYPVFHEQAIARLYPSALVLVEDVVHHTLEVAR